VVEAEVQQPTDLPPVDVAVRVAPGEERDAEMHLLHVACHWVNVAQKDRPEGRTGVLFRPQVSHKVQKGKAAVQFLGARQLSSNFRNDEKRTARPSGG